MQTFIRPILLLLLSLISISKVEASEICEGLADQLSQQKTNSVLAQLLPESRNLELLQRAQKFIPKSRIETGMKLAEYLRRAMPTKFRLHFAREYKKVLDYLESGEVVAEFRPLKGAQAVYARGKGQLSVDTIYGNRVSAVRMFLDIAHEMRHAITHRVYRPKHKFETFEGMTKAEFVQKNLDPILSDEAISYYEQMIFVGRLASMEYFRPFAAECIYEAGILRDLTAEMVQKNPAPGKETLAVIKDFVIREPAYHQLFTNHLSQVYDYYQKSDGGIGSLNGSEYWY
ncbi:hypothetical protein E3A20_19990 [Planctomyces bekefii]|uniref:Uncharacterized protein n=1 Tax=Planctomyces bekefii TaxID=1653850 RepID=A0A5C6M748_9PLAN|nr:hypothetical protein E3A20_19990 [Planctomyces bekefii]